jgi:NAD(P)-dependent dehydrogenase (short-subunit alcohol dehydrogenase family)
MAVILITGANRGIGYGIVQAYATSFTNATIILGCRVLENGLEAIQRLGVLGVKTKLDVLQIDIDDNESVAAAAKSVKEKHGQLDGKVVCQTVLYIIH